MDMFPHATNTICLYVTETMDDIRPIGLCCRHVTECYI